MKKKILLFLVVLILNCVLPYDDFFVFNDPQFKTLMDVENWITDNIVYKKDYPNDNCQAAQETLDRGRGDCEDYSRLFLEIVNYQFNKTGFIQVGYNKTKKKSHAWAVIDNKKYFYLENYNPVYRVYLK